MLIRKMTLPDVTQAAELERQCFSMPWSAHAFEESLLNENVVYIVVEENGIIIGNCGLRNILGEAEITNVAVAEAYRGQGIARRMLETLLTEGRKIGAQAFTLEVRSGDRKSTRLNSSH